MNDYFEKILQAEVYEVAKITPLEKANNLSNTLNITIFEVDSKSPIIVELIPVQTPTSDSTPDYTFSSNEAGTISLIGKCSTLTKYIINGYNTVKLVLSGTGNYSNCSITVTDAAGNISEPLSLSSFDVFEQIGRDFKSG